jgi:transposase
MVSRQRKLKIEERLELLEQVKATGNVAEACKTFGVSRPCFYKWRARYEREGLPGLQDQSKASRSHPRKLDIGTREVVVRFALMKPWLGCHALSHALSEEIGREVSGTAVHRILKERDLETVAQRVKESTKLLVKHQHLRIPATWDYICQRNPLIGVIGTSGVRRGSIFQAAFLPHPNPRSAGRQSISGEAEPWAFVMVDGSSGYVTGRIRIGMDEECYWIAVMKEVHSICNLLNVVPDIVQSYRYLDQSEDIQSFAIKNIFKDTIVQSLTIKKNIEDNWIKIFIKYLSKYWKKSSGKKIDWLSEQTQFNEIIQRFNSSYINEGFPNFGEPPEDLFWPGLKKMVEP